jgi:hypothetical protein
VIYHQRAFERLPAVLAPSSDEQVVKEFVHCASEVAEPGWAAALGYS